MGSKSATRRARIAARLAESAHLFYPERVDQFLCPTSLDWLPLSDTDSITEAHILPKAAGGRLWTLACRRCNSKFGSRQDKWLGEYLQLSRLEQPTIFHATTQRGYFFIGDVRVSGRWRVTDDGSLEFTVLQDHTSPDALAAVPNQIEETITRSLFPPGPLYEHRRRMTVTVPLPPVIENEELALLGFLTAAYFLWFQELGYSWALQHHLDIVRQQIQAATLSVLPRSFCSALPKELQDGLWLGFGRVNGELALLTGIEEQVVLFPPADTPGFYDRLPPDTLHGARLEILGRVRFGKRHAWGGPKAVVYDKRLVVCPDVFPKGRHPLILVPDHDGPLQALNPISAEHFAELKQRYPDGGITLTSTTRIPDKDTGR